MRRFWVLGLLVWSIGCGDEGTLVTIEEESGHDPSFFAEGPDLASLLQEMDGHVLAPPVAAHGVPFDRVSILYDANTDGRPEMRVSDDGGRTYGAWAATETVFDEEGAFVALADAPEGGTHVQVRFDDAATVTALSVALYVVPEGAPGLDEQEGLDLAADGETEAALSFSDFVVPGSAWGRRAATATCGGFHSPNKITIHHTATPTNDSISVEARLRQIESEMVFGRNFCGMGYHFIVGQNGKVYEGRPRARVGAHAKGANTNNIGISFMGNYQGALPSAQMREAGATILKMVADEYGIALNRQKVKGHRQVGVTVTDCPGHAMYGHLEAFIDMAKNGTGPIDDDPIGEPDCSSATVGTNVPSGSTVQVTYAGCGLDTCGWYLCAAGSWSCTAGPGAEDAFPNAACDNGPIDDDPIDDDGCAYDACPTQLPFVYNDSTTGGGDDFDNYSCAPGTNESGPERVVQVTVPSDGTLSATVTDGAGVDIDVHILSAHSAGACLDRDDASAEAAVTAGEYFVVFDSYVKQSGAVQDGAFNAVIDFVPEEDDPGDTTPVCDADACTDTFPFNYTASTVGGSDDFDMYNCAPGTNEAGPERVVRATLPSTGVITATLNSAVNPDNVDIDVHILTSLDDNACVSRGHWEAAAHLGAGDVYIVLDSWVSGSGTVFAGDFDLDVTFTPDVPDTEPPPMGECPTGVTCLNTFPAAIEDTTVGGPSDLDGYACAPDLDESGPEKVVRVTLAEPGFLGVSLTDGADVDVDVHILTGATPSTCVDRGNVQAGAFLPAGDAWVVFDSFDNMAGPFEADITVSTTSTLTGHGLSQAAAEAALHAYGTAYAQGYSDRPEYTVVDFSLPSDQRRLWTINLATGQLLFHEFAAHGKNSGDPADIRRSNSFSNVNGSNKSSLGLVKTAESYFGSHGLSLRLDGLEPANSNVRPRAIVVHGAWYAEPSFVQQNGYTGRSLGCPAVSDANVASLVNTIKEGALMFGYYPDADYMATSPFMP